MNSQDDSMRPVADTGDHRLIRFFVNGRPFETAKHSLTAAEIKRIADVPLDYQLILDPHDHVIHNHESVQMKEGLHFEAGPHGKVS
jgi:hypothetical protein